MSTEQKNTISFMANTFAKVMLSLCGGLLTLLYIQMKAEVSEFKNEVKTEFRDVKNELKDQGNSVNTIQVKVAKIEGYLKYKEK